MNQTSIGARLLMRYIRIILSILFVIFFIPSVQSKLILDGSIVFQDKVRSYLATASLQSNDLKLLIVAAEKSRSIITITPITNNKKTWHKSGKKSRSHTEAIDNKRRGKARNTATNSIIFINKNRIAANHKSFCRGTLIHELVHALDLANGKYNKDYSIREKRAVFFQNIWSSIHRSRLRTSYHRRFSTTEYQNSIASNTVDVFISHYFSHSDIP